MTTAAPLISICIPTYHRASLLEEALETLRRQWEKDLTNEQRDRLEILVSDNHSPDGTPDVLTRFGAANPEMRFSYIRQPENIGPSANMLNLFGRATGDYVILISDDDLLLPGALAGMLSLVQNNPGAAAFCLNSRPFIHNPAEEIMKPDFSVEADRMISDPSDCLRFLGTRITFLSVLMFRRDRLDPEGYESRTSSLLFQSYPFLDVLATAGGLYITRQVFLAVRGNNTGGYNFYEIFVTSFAEVMRYARSQGYSESAVRAVLSQHLIRFLAPFTASFKLHGTYGKLQPDFRDGIRRLRTEYGAHPFFIFGLLPLMLAPHALARGIHGIIHRLKSKTE